MSNRFQDELRHPRSRNGGGGELDIIAWASAVLERPASCQA